MVLNFEKIIFDSLAWDHLEVDPDHKFLLRALVDASRDDRSGELMTDVVKGGKGGGKSITRVCPAVPLMQSEQE